MINLAKLIIAKDSLGGQRTQFRLKKKRGLHKSLHLLKLKGKFLINMIYYFIINAIYGHCRKKGENDKNQI